MRPRMLRAAGRRLRNVVLPLVGFWNLVALLEELSARLDAVEARLPREHEALEEALIAQDARLAGRLETEINRLDGYLLHHAATLRAQLADLHADIPSLRAQLVDLHADIPSLRDPLAALLARPERVCAVPGVGTLLLDAGFDLIVPTEEIGVLSFLLRHSVDGVEPGVRAVLADRLQPGDVAIDGGANVGVHALTMAKVVGPTGGVICFEPLAHLAHALAATLRLNGVAGHVRVERAALSDNVGEATFYAARHSPLSSLFDLPESMESQRIVVPQTSLDAHMPPGSRVNVVKLDVEGAEPRAWRGMSRIRNENPRLDVVMEWSASHFGRAEESPTEFFQTIRAEGFSLFVIDNTPKAARLTALADPLAAASLEGANVLVTRRPRD